MSLPIVKFVLTAALRDKILITFLLLVLVISSLSSFFGTATVTEQSAFALVYRAGSLRMVGAAGVILFICFYIRRAFENREVEFLLSRPVSRLDYVLSHAAAFSIIAAIVAMSIALTVLISGGVNLTGWFLWSFSLFVEYSLLALLSLFFSMVISSAAGAALICFSFYALARMMGLLLGIAGLPPEDMIAQILNMGIEFISIFVPRLDLMGQTGWLIYGGDALAAHKIAETGSVFDRTLADLGLVWYIYSQWLVYSILLLVATGFDFIRKQF